MPPARPKPDLDLTPVVALAEAIRDDIAELRQQLEQTTISLQDALAGQTEVFRQNLEGMIMNFLKIVASTLAKAVFSTIGLGALAYVWSSVIASWHH